MANGWHISFESSRVFLTPQGKGNFNLVDVKPGANAVPPPKSFTVVTGLFPRMRNDASGTAPIAPGAQPAAAEIEFIARLKGQTTFMSLGVLKGNVDFNTANSKPLPRFTVGTIDVSDGMQGNVKTSHKAIDYTPVTDVVVTRSDWVLTVHPDTDTFPIDGNAFKSFDIQLPWIFDINHAILELSARLRVGGTVAADETRNTPLQIPLTHNGVLEDLDVKKSLITLHGLRTVMPASLERPGIPLAANPLNIFIHENVTTFLSSNSTNTSIAVQVRAGIQASLSDLGFTTINIVMSGDATYKTELARFDSFFALSNGQYFAKGMSNVTSPPPNSTASAFLPDRLSTVPGEGASLPFFDCFVAREDRNPQKNEIGLGETFNVGGTAGVAAGTKLVCSPILILGGVGSSKGLRNEMSRVDPQDHGNLVANVISHEVGHTLGLRHGLSFLGSPPYVFNDPDSIPNSLMYLTENLQSAGAKTTGARARLNFFGPVQRNALRTAYQIP